MHETAPIIYWLRQDLRLRDNPALLNAVHSGRPVVALIVHDTVTPGLRPMGSAQKWWLHHSLSEFQRALARLGGRLVIRSGESETEIEKVVAETSASAICWNRRYGHAEQTLDRSIKLRCKDNGMEATSHAALLMHEPSQIQTGQGNPYKVYTPFWKAFNAGPSPRQPLEPPQSITPYSGELASLDVEQLELRPRSPDWSGPLAHIWSPGEKAAQEQLSLFADTDIDTYSTSRDLPGPDRTSRLSPHLRFGEISPYQLWHASYQSNGGMDSGSRETWRKELVWREFSYHLLQHWPHLAVKNFQSKFDHFPWLANAQALSAWQTGMTGYPIIDAGMRQLYQTGWMHNRVRMIVASFLVKHLLIDWREGERWFWDTLVDGDPASNPAQWQWVAGSGADASPYFRIFNPILQSEKFDPSGEYIYRYVPELQNLAAIHLAAPWDAPLEVLAKAGIVLGETYPKPIVDHKSARERALDALSSMKSSLSDDD